LRSIDISTSGFRDRRFEFGKRPTSEMPGDVDSVMPKSGLVENVGVEVEIASISQTVQKLLPFPFLRLPSWSLDLRLPVACDSNGSSTVGFLDLEKTGGGGVCRWNLVPMCHRTRGCLGSVATPPSGLRVSEIGSGLGPYRDRANRAAARRADSLGGGAAAQKTPQLIFVQIYKLLCV